MFNQGIDTIRHPHLRTTVNWPVVLVLVGLLVFWVLAIAGVRHMVGG